MRPYKGSDKNVKTGVGKKTLKHENRINTSKLYACQATVRHLKMSSWNRVGRIETISKTKYTLDESCMSKKTGVKIQNNL